MRKLLVLLPLLFAATSAPSGTITANFTEAHYGDTVTFTTSVSGAKPQAKVYTNVVCLQGAVVVYQSSVEPFELVDQAGDNLNWDGQAADCIASLVYRIDKPRTTITYLDQTGFHVEHAVLPS